MKQLLLFSLIIGFALSTTGQTGMVAKKNQKRVKAGQEVVVKRTNPAPLPKLKQGNAVNEDVTRITVGMAGSQRGIRREEAHLVTYNYELDVIGVTDILDPETYPNVDEYGVIGLWYSEDHGQNWNGPVILNDDFTVSNNYYIAGSLYNPEGNTAVDDMFGVSQGTLDLGGAMWYYKTFGSSTLAGEYQTNYLFEGDPDKDDGYWNIFGLGQIGDEMRCLNMIPDGPWAGYTVATLQPIVGEFDGEIFDWDLSNLVDANLFNGSDGEICWTGMYVSFDAGCEMAWADDGQIGYMWMIGISDEDPTGYQPVVFRTEDAGENWDYIYLDFFDGDIQDILEPYVIESYAGYMIPHVKESAGVVDANGDLQMMVAMGGTSADVITYPDSIGWAWVYPGDLFNVSVNADGISDLMWVDSLRTENVEQDDANGYAGAGWQHRIYAAKSQDEQQVFFTWTDTRDSEANEFNYEPDLFGWSRAFCENPLIMESTVCFSEGSELEEVFYFNSGCDRAYFNGETYTVPTIQGVTPVEFVTNTSNSADPITLSYVTGIEFPVLCVTGVEELTSANKVNVSQNIPNPFNGYTTIEVSTETTAVVTVEVSNIMGQSIYILNAGTINGTQEIELSAQNLEAGIYFYTVHIGNESITKKMIVE